MTETAGNKSRRTARGGCDTVRRRGSIYAVVMAMAILVSLIGLSAVAVGRINLRTASAGGDAATAELLAASAIEHAISVVNSEAGWRGNTNYHFGQKTPPVALGNGEFSWKLVDEIDGNIELSTGGVQPVRVYGTGHAGDAWRTYSVSLVPSGANLLSNPNIESGRDPFEPESGNCSVDASATAPRDGLRALSVRSRVNFEAGPRQEVTAKITSGKFYYAEAWIKMAASPEKPKIVLVVRGSGGSANVSNWEKTFKAAPADNVGLEWQKVSVALNPEWDGDLDRIYWRIETTSTTQDFWVDDVKLIESTSSGTAMPMAPARETWKQEPAQ